MTDLKGWISTKSKLPEKSYTRPFLLVVKNKDNDYCRVMIGVWSCFTDVGDAFSCWDKCYINGNGYTMEQPVPMERVLYWRQLPEIPDDIKGKLIQ